MREPKLVNKLRNIHAINRVPMKEFRECMQIVKDFTYIDTPDDFIFESLKDRLNHRQIERLIEYYKWYHNYHTVIGVSRAINKLFPKKIVKEAKLIEKRKTENENLAKSVALRNQRYRTLKKWRERMEFEKWMKQHRPTVKTRKPKPKKTFWHVSKKTAKYRSIYKK